jgi:hypothetical protein
MGAAVAIETTTATGREQQKQQRTTSKSTLFLNLYKIFLTSSSKLLRPVLNIRNVNVEGNQVHVLCTLLKHIPS